MRSPGLREVRGPVPRSVPKLRLEPSPLLSCVLYHRFLGPDLCSLLRASENMGEGRRRLGRASEKRSSWARPGLRRESPGALGRDPQEVLRPTGHCHPPAGPQPQPFIPQAAPGSRQRGRRRAPLPDRGSFRRVIYLPASSGEPADEMRLLFPPRQFSC